MKLKTALCRANQCLFGPEKALVQKTTDGQNYPEGKKAKRVCFAQYWVTRKCWKVCSHGTIQDYSLHGAEDEAITVFTHICLARMSTKAEKKTLGNTSTHQDANQPKDSLCDAWQKQERKSETQLRFLKDLFSLQRGFYRTLPLYVRWIPQNIVLHQYIISNSKRSEKTASNQPTSNAVNVYRNPKPPHKFNECSFAEAQRSHGPHTADRKTSVDFYHITGRRNPSTQDTVSDSCFLLR